MANSLYPDLENNFPSSVDNFDRFQDPNVSALSYINEYYRYFNSGNLTAAENVLVAHPELKTMIINADNMNKLRDAVVSMERFYLSDFEEYIVNAISWVGDWNKNNEYTKFNVVNYIDDENRSLCYIAIQNVPRNTNITNDNYWKPITIKGDQGIPGVGLNVRGVWKTNTNYVVNDCVTHNLCVWGCSQDNVNQTPSKTSEYWYIILDGQNLIDELSSIAEEYLNLSKSYAVGTGNIARDGDSTDNSKFYYNKSKTIASGLSGTYMPMGKCKFADLADEDVVMKVAGFTYIVTDSFVSDNRFEDGGGYYYPSNSLIYYSLSNKWGCYTSGIREIDVINNFHGNNTVFNIDGSITETANYGTKKTVFNADGSISETFSDGKNITITKKTVFNADGSISENLV